MTPRNVWENSSTDRVSERIIGNIFDSSIVVADITDLNPNVMLELGMRLASKKPTIVIMALGNNIPFDIRDFHIVDYPFDLSMLPMERFSTKLTKLLVEKGESFADGTYTPFLNSIIVDVISPERREVSYDTALLARLDELDEKIERISVGNRSRSGSLPTINDITEEAGLITVILPQENSDKFYESAWEMFEVDQISRSGSVGNTTRVRVRYSGASDVSEFARSFLDILAKHGGRLR